SGILLKNENLKQLLDNEWIYLLIMDPTENNQVKRFTGDMVWQPLSEETADTIKDFKSEMAPVN
ncbi:MAG: hypothetical protein KJO51_00790, partial [Gramella sp.]|nr:hypothetical protein [Christiangramia sp.]